MMPSDVQSRFRAFFQENEQKGGNKIRKYANYLDIYETVLSKFVDRRPRILEIGVQHGGSLNMWNDFFQGKVEIFGIDILQECMRFERNNVRIFIGDQSDNSFLEMISSKLGDLDIIIDDGSHIPRHQINTFKLLFFKNLRPGGIYFVEDCHTSYWPGFGGGVRRRGTFIEYAKRLCDDINAWHAANLTLPVTEATQWISRITFASSLVIFEKEQMSAPEVLASGLDKINTEDVFGEGQFGRIFTFLRRFAILRTMVRRNPFLWAAMRRAIHKSDYK